MTPLLLFTIGGSFKKQIYFSLAVLVIIVSLPAMAVFALGSGTLEFLNHFIPHSSTSQGIYEGALDPSDTYAWGNCTWWVYKLRKEAGDPIPTTWGNAATWAFNATLDGYDVDHTPAPGSIMQTADSAKGLGHVAYITAVDSNTGDWTISEMNSIGLDIVDTKVHTAAEAKKYNFIHDKETVQNVDIHVSTGLLTL